MRIRFPIGDWSDDGHGQCDYYFANTSKNTQDVREAHFKCEEVFGFNIGELACEWEDNFIREDILECLINEGIVGKEFKNSSLDSKAIFKIWLAILNKIDPTLELTSKIDNSYEDINFYGYDDKKRHLDTPGYGVFTDF